MKEYWVNVYEDGSDGLPHCSRNIAVMVGEFANSPSIYRFYVRELDTREAKELYLKMKYGNKTSYYMNWDKNLNVQQIGAK